MLQLAAATREASVKGTSTHTHSALLSDMLQTYCPFVSFISAEVTSPAPFSASSAMAAEDEATVGVSLDSVVQKAAELEGLLRGCRAMTCGAGRRRQVGEEEWAAECNLQSAGEYQYRSGPRLGEYQYRSGPRLGEYQYRSGPRLGEYQYRSGSRLGEYQYRSGPRLGEYQ